MRTRCALIALVITMACGQLGRGAPSPTGITITLSDTGCTADGVGALLPDQFRATLVNKTLGVMAFLVKRLNDGHAYAELEAVIAQRQQRIASNGPSPNDGEFKPGMATDQRYTWVSPGQTLTWEATLTSGTYGIVCRRDSVAVEAAEAIYLVGPFRVV